MPNRALLVKDPWASWIVSGHKTIEIRTRRTTKIGKEIYIAKSGSKTLIGKVTIEACKELTLEDYIKLKDQHLAFTYLKIPDSNEEFKKYSKENLFKTKSVFGWFLKNPVKFEEPIPYNHPKGAQMWVIID